MLLICHTVLHGQIFSQFENKDTIFHMEVVSVMLLESKESIGIDMYGF